MNLNDLSFYRANPFSNNQFIPVASMNNRKLKDFPSQIPQGQNHLPERPGRRIFREKLQSEIQKEKILNSPERYPFQNRIALDKHYRRNLDTIDIEGAASGTKMSECIRNKHKALEQLKRKNNQPSSQNLVSFESLDQIYDKKRRLLAQEIQKTLELKKSRIESNSKVQQSNELSSSRKKNTLESSENNQPQLLAEYQRFITHNSNQKFTPTVFRSEFEGFPRYKRPQATISTLSSLSKYQSINNSKIETIQMEKNQSINDQSPNPSIKNQKTHQTINRGHSVQPIYSNNRLININNRHRSNPEYIDQYPLEYQKRVEEIQNNKFLEQNIKNTYTGAKQLRKYNPTNLSFNIAAKTLLMGPII